jgi:hypothetical protein
MNPQIGQIVNYVLKGGKSEGEIRPAIVVRKWSETCVQLQVFTDCSNDGPEYTPNVVWKTSVLYSAATKKEPGTWHNA